MRFVAALWLILLGVLFVACGGDDKTGGAAISGTMPLSTTAAAGGATPPVAPTQAAAGGLTELSLVYVDARAGTPQLFVSKSDGSGARKLLDLPRGSRVLDVRDNAALTGGGEANLSLVDLKDGKTTDLKPAGSVADARFLDDSTIVYITNGGCAPPSGNSVAQLMNLKDGSKKELLSNRGVTITIAGAGRDGKLALSPRGCDVSVLEVVYYADARSGASTSKTETRGCGWVAASLETMDAVASWLSCTQPPDKKDVEATVYALLPGTRAPRDLKPGTGGPSNQQPWVMRPGRPEIAMGTSMTVGTGPGSTRGGGLWLVDVRTGAATTLIPFAGAEQYAVRWTPDGRYLLASTVQAQGLCLYSVVEPAERKVTQLPEALSFCGANGSVWGFTSLR
jgi:hypothetical protein